MLTKQEDSKTTSKLLILLVVVIGNMKNKYLNIIYYFIVIIFVCFWIIIPISKNKKLKKYDFYIVKTNSMVPVLSTGSLIIVNKESDYKIGDIITFKYKNNIDIIPITHRIINSFQKKEETVYVTKGDANDIVDIEIIKKSEIIGKTIFVIPIIGMFLEIAQTQIGSIFYIIIPAIIFISKEIWNIKKWLSLH